MVSCICYLMCEMLLKWIFINSNAAFWTEVRPLWTHHLPSTNKLTFLNIFSVIWLGSLTLFWLKWLNFFDSSYLLPEIWWLEVSPCKILAVDFILLTVSEEFKHISLAFASQYLYYSLERESTVFQIGNRNQSKLKYS